MSRFALAATLLGTVLLSLLYCTIGAYPAHLTDLFRAAVGSRLQDPLSAYVILVLRLPRAVAGCLVGMALGLAGAITQAVLQNPIAEPGTLGLNAGASFAALLTLVYWTGMPAVSLPFAAFAGAWLATFCVLLLSSSKGLTLAPQKIVVSGILVSLVLSAGILIVITFGQVYALEGALRWMLGSLSDVTWTSVTPVACVLSIALPIALLASRILEVHALGDRSAKSLGARVVRERMQFLILTAALAGGAVATAGPIAFAGLLAPNAARSLHPRMDKQQLLLSALVGGALVLTADMLGRLLFRTVEVPCGLVTAIVGAPCLFVLLVRRSRAWRR